MKTSARIAAFLLTVLLPACSMVAGPPPEAGLWTESERALIASLSISRLDPLGPDPTNRFADDPAAVALGHALFFDTRLSINGQVSCGTCHRPELDFQDGVALAVGVGQVPRRTMPVAGTAYMPFLMWDGRKDSQWAQALGPLESPVEHGGSRTLYAHVLAEHYRAEYEALFGPMPALAHLPRHAGPVEDPEARAAWEAMGEADREAVTRVFVNLGKAIAAYERKLTPGRTRFDEYADLVGQGRQPGALLTADETTGLALFIGKGACLDCHNGPLLTDNHFHNTGIPAVEGLPEDRGRALGGRQVLEDEFNCLSPFSDASPEECTELRFMAHDEHRMLRAYKPPSLRNVERHAPFMHAGQMGTLVEVLRHYNEAPEAPAGHSELRPLGLTETELRQLEAFLLTLSAPIVAPPGLLVPPARP
jgi:cytochrome c peroxidase